MSPAHYRIRVFCEMNAGLSPRYAVSVARNGRTIELEDASTRADALRIATAKTRAARKLYGQKFAEAMTEESAIQAMFLQRHGCAP